MRGLRGLFLSTALLLSARGGLCQNETVAPSCSLCPSLFGHANLDCQADSPPGCLADMFVCRCQHDCRNITMQCNPSGQWGFLNSNGPFCLANSSYSNRSIGSNRRASYSHQSGVFTFSCTPGYQLVGTSDVTCTNNVLSGPFPQCVQRSRPTDILTSTTPAMNNSTIFTTTENTEVTLSRTVLIQTTAIIPIREISTQAMLTSVINTFTFQPTEQTFTTTGQPNEITTTIEPEVEGLSETAIIIISSVSVIVIVCIIIFIVYILVMRNKKNKLIKQRFSTNSQGLPNMYELPNNDNSYMRYMSMIDANFVYEDPEQNQDNIFENAPVDVAV